MVQMSEAEQEETDVAETQKPETEPIFSDIPEPETGDILIAESGNEPEQESKTEAESEKESETESETESEKNGAYQVAVTKGRELGVVLNREDGNYNAGDTVQFSTNLPAGSL